MGESEANCREILRQLYLYLDGEVAGGDCAVIERHLSSCSPCMQHAEFERAVKEVVRRKCGSERAPAELVDRLRDQLRER